ncbi:hypothetical protein GCM10020254_77460 [Streptomyces goshikiensis]
MESGADGVRRFRIHGMSGQVARLLDLTGTRPYFPDCADPEGAGHDRQ